MPPPSQPLPLALVVGTDERALRWRAPSGPCPPDVADALARLVAEANAQQLTSPGGIVVAEPPRRREALPVGRRSARRLLGANGRRLHVVGLHVAGLERVPVGAALLVEMPEALKLGTDPQGGAVTIYGAAARLVGYVDAFGALHVYPPQPDGVSAG